MLCTSIAQEVPSREENIPFLVTFGKDADKSYGDDDYSQVFFFSIPPEYNKPFYIKVFDPDVGGKNDEKVNSFNTITSFAVYGGKGCITDKDASNTDPVGNYRSGNLLGSKKFDGSDTYDDKWYVFGPFDPKSGEYVEQYGGHVFKIVAEGTTGDDGNLYKYFLSTDEERNISIEGSNSFTFEYTFRMQDSHHQISHIYPFVGKKVTAIQIATFDWDSDGDIKVYSKAVIGRKVNSSGDGVWRKSRYTIKPSEKGSSLDIRFEKQEGSAQRNNNVVMNITNQYGENLPFYSAPIGGIPKFKVDIDVRILK